MDKLWQDAQINQEDAVMKHLQTWHKKSALASLNTGRSVLVANGFVHVRT